MRCSFVVIRNACDWGGRREMDHSLSIEGKSAKIFSQALKRKKFSVKKILKFRCFEVDFRRKINEKLSSARN